MPSEGTGNNERVGTEIDVRGIMTRMRLAIYKAGDNTDNQVQIMRCIWFATRDSGPLAPTGAGASLFGFPTEITGNFGPEAFQRYKIISDKIYYPPASVKNNGADR